MIPALSDLHRARVLIVGDLMLDRYWTGPTERISPEAPVPVVRIDAEEHRPGGAGNVALNVTALGGSARLIGAVGNDHEADTLAGLLREKRVETDWLVLDGRRTLTKLRVLSRHQQLIRLDFEQGFAGLDSGAVLARAQSALGETGALVLSDYGKGTLADTRALIDAARAAGKPVLVDPKGTDFERYRGATVITPNFHEFIAVVGPCADEAEVVARGERLVAELALDALLVTRGEHGMSLIRAGEPALHLPTRAREVFDVTGAGDTVIGTLAAALAIGMDFPAATSLANVAAGIVVGKLGTSTASAAEIEQALHLAHSAEFGALDEDALAKAVELAQQRGERVVMTNGCFDLLHAGHVSYLERARELGDRLIVAVNTDDSVRRQGKSGNRPVVPLAQRMEVLAALSAVDWVVAFDEDTPQRLICRLLPDVLVKGADYSPEQIAGGDCVRANGGSVQTIELVAGCSTSGIIERIRQSDD